MVPAGRRDRWITLQRATMTVDAHGGETPSWSSLGKVKALVRWGTSQERRDAAQISAVQSATFVVPANGTTRGLTAEDRLQFEGSAWDIKGVAVLRFGVEISAVRKAA